MADMHTKFKNLPINASFFTDALPDPDHSVEYVKVSNTRGVVAPWCTATSNITRSRPLELPFHDEENVIDAEFVPF